MPPPASSPILLFKEGLVYDYMYKRLQGSQLWAMVGWRVTEDTIFLFIACFLCLNYNEWAWATFIIKNGKVHFFTTIYLSSESLLCSLSSWYNCLPRSLSLAARFPCCLIFLVLPLPHVWLPKDQLSAHPPVLSLTDCPAQNICPLRLLNEWTKRLILCH